MRKVRIAHRAFTGFQKALETQTSTFPSGDAASFDLVPFDPPDFVARFIEGDELLTGDWDVVMLLTDWIPLLADRGGIRRLDAWLSVDGPASWPHDFHDGVLRLADVDGSTWALPYHDGPQALIYRTDLFGDPVEREAFKGQFGRDLDAPSTWQDFLDVAAFFSRREQGLSGCVVAGYPDGHNTVYDFLIQLWARGGQLLDGASPAFDSDAGVEAATWLRDLLNSGTCQPDPLAYDSVRAGEVFANGRAAMMWNWLGFAVAAEMPGSDLQGKIACAPMPGLDGPDGPTLSLYWTLAIPVSAPDPELSWRLLRHFATPLSDLITARSGAVAVRLSSWRSPELREQFSAYSVIEDAHVSARNIPQIANYPTINEALNVALDGIYRGGADPRTALTEAARSLRKTGAIS